MIDERFVILGAIIAGFGSIKYIIETIRGNVKPNKVTFLLWSLAPLIAFAAEIKEGVGIQSLLTFVVGFFPLLVFISSFLNKNSEWKLSNFDLICGAISLIGILLWYLTKTGIVAIFFAILADWIAALPTYVKAYRYPETENVWLYSTGIINALLTLLAINNWNFANYGFPVYILLLDLSLSMIIKRRSLFK